MAAANDEGAAANHDERPTGRDQPERDRAFRPRPVIEDRDPEIARLARPFGGTASRSRAAVIAEYTAALRIRAIVRGAKVFERECKPCHKVGDRGFALGPDLTGSPSADPAALLANILDPTAVVQPGYLQYLVVDHDGRTYSGVIAAETATSLTLRRGDGAEDTILRAQVAEIAGTGLSMMPEGFEKTIAKAEMADLIAFLRGRTEAAATSMATNARGRWRSARCRD